MNEKAAIYHFTDKSKARPTIYQKDLDQLKEFAGSLGYNNPDIYIDFTLRRSDQSEKFRLLSNADQYKAVVTKDFYHLAKNTAPCLNLMELLKKKGVKVITKLDGAFDFSPPPVHKQRTVALYYCGLEMMRPVDLQMEIMRAFINNETNWRIGKEYIDTNGNRRASNQTEIMQMFRDTNEFDLVVTRCFNDINWATSKFCKYRNILGCDIYSLHEDVLLPYGKGGQNE